MGYYSTVIGEIKPTDLKALLEALEREGFTVDDGWLYDPTGDFTGFEVAQDRLTAVYDTVKAYGFGFLAQTLQTEEFRPLLEKLYMLREGEEPGDLEGYSYTPDEDWQEYIVHDVWAPTESAERLRQWLRAFTGEALEWPSPVLLIHAKDIGEWGVALLGKIIYRVPADAGPYCPSAQEVADNVASVFGLKKAPVLEAPGRDWEEVAENLKKHAKPN